MQPLSSFAFQVGLALLLAIQVRTRATGTGRVARAFLVVEHLLLAGAMVSSLNDAFFPGAHGSLYWHLFDACWPLSMLGMFGIGIRIAIAGRWKGAARVWPLVAESWAPVVIPVSGLVPAAAAYVGGAHLLIGYAALGLILATQCNVLLLRRWTPAQILVTSLAGGAVAGLVLLLFAALDFGGLFGILVPLWLVLAASGLALPNAPALALSRHGEAAGTAAALLGAVQFGVGAAVSPVVGVLGNDALAMGIVIVTAMTLALAVLLFVVRPWELPVDDDAVTVAVH